MSSGTPADADEPLLLIARHGQGHANITRVIAGRSCPGLTATGQAQARGLARRLARTGGVTAIHFSTTLRARQSAQIIGTALGVNPRRQHGLRVPDPGDAEGMRWVDARRAWPPDPLAPRRPRARGSEPWQAYLERARQALEQIMATHPGGRVLVVGHAETLDAMATLPAISDDRRPVTTLDFCAVSTWRVAGPAL